jgi:hypothetical protein
MDKKQRTVAIAAGSGAAVLGIAVAVSFVFLGQAQDNGSQEATQQVQSVQKDHPDAEFIYKNPGTNKVESSTDNASGTKESTSNAPSASQQAANTNVNAVQVESPSYSAQVNAEGNKITVFKQGSSTAVREYNFAGKNVSAGEKFVNQLDWVTPSVFAFTSTESTDGNVGAHLYVYSVDSADVIADYGTYVQQWFSIEQDGKYTIAYADTVNGVRTISVGENGSTARNVIRGADGTYGLLPYKNSIAVWYQSSENKVTIVSTSGKKEAAVDVEGTASFLYGKGNDIIVGTDSGIYSWNGSSSKKLKSYDKEDKPFTDTVKINADKGFVTQQHSVNSETQSSVYSVEDNTLNWVNTTDVTVW